MNKSKITLLGVLIFLGISHYSCRESTITPGLLGNISGEVVSARDTLPIENATISTNPSTNIKNSDFDGRFTYTDIPEGTYVLRIDKEGYISKSINIEVTDGVTSDLVVSLEDNDLFNKPPSAPILVSPEIDFETLNNASLQLSWYATDNENDELKYDLRIYNEDLSFDEIVLSESTDTMFIFENFNYSTNYFWQVAVTDGINDKRYGEVWNFRSLDFPLYPYYFANKSLTSDIQIYATDTVNQILISPPGKPSWRPRMNSDKDQVACISIDNIETHIFLMNIDGGNFRRISDVPIGGIFEHELEIDWLPDDSGIVYPNYNRLYSVNIDGTTTKEIINIAPDRVISEVAINNVNGDYAIVSSTLVGTEYQILIINEQGVLQDTIIEFPTGRIGGLDYSADGSQLLYTYDVSGFTSQEGRMLDSRIFRYNFNNGIVDDLSFDKKAGTNDLDPSFAPNNGSIIFTNKDNVLIGGPGSIYTTNLGGTTRELQIEEGYMPDWN